MSVVLVESELCSWSHALDWLWGLPLPTASMESTQKASVSILNVNNHRTSHGYVTGLCLPLPLPIRRLCFISESLLPITFSLDALCSLLLGSLLMAMAPSVDSAPQAWWGASTLLSTIWSPPQSSPGEAWGRVTNPYTIEWIESLTRGAEMIEHFSSKEVCQRTCHLLIFMIHASQAVLAKIIHSCLPGGETEADNQKGEWIFHMTIALLVPYQLFLIILV